MKGIHYEIARTLHDFAAFFVPLFRLFLLAAAERRVRRVNASPNHRRTASGTAERNRKKRPNRGRDGSV